MRDAAYQQAVTPTFPQRIRTQKPAHQPQELLQGVGRVGVHQPEHGRSCTGRRESAEDKGRHREEITGQDQREERRQAHGKSLMIGNFQDEKKKCLYGWLPAGLFNNQ